MPITILELLAADTISQAVDKINLNFDQLLLNGGGPPGSIGPTGPTGPVGGRGLRGTIWFEDPATSPGTNPNTLSFSGLLDGDSYLQSNGAVWEYDGTTWSLTQVNLIGPQGPQGSGSGFEFFNGGSGALIGKRAAYLGPLEVATGATTSNEGVSAIMVGGVVSNTTPDPVGFTSAYKIDDVLAKTIQSDTVSLFIHQKDSSTSSIKFHGGGSISADKFEQTDIAKLSNILLREDDCLVINIPKAPTTPVTATADLIGFKVETFEKSQKYESGKNIKLSTGLSTVSTGFAGEDSDFLIDIGESNSSNPAKFEIGLRPSGYNSILQLGGGITASPIASYTPTRTGKFYLETGDSFIYSSLTSNIGAQGAINIRSKTSSINTNSTSSTNIINNGTGGINITQNGGGSIQLVNSAGDIAMVALGSITQSATGDITTVSTLNTTITATGNLTQNGTDILLNSTGQTALTAAGTIGLTSSSFINIKNTSASNSLEIASDKLQSNITNLNAPGIKIKGYFGPAQSSATAVGVTDAKDFALISHSYKTTVLTNEITLNYIKVGGVIHVSGRVILGGVDPTIDLPFKLNDGTVGVSGSTLPVTSLFGQGVWNDGANMYPVHVVVDNLNIQKFCFFQNQATGSPIPASSSLTTLNVGTGATQQVRIVKSGTINFQFSYTVGMF
tara:strand:- start:66234 stop:68255 length:2022 start_codon:yes stop_codon:yes gene_type:complete